MQIRKIANRFDTTDHECTADEDNIQIIELFFLSDSQEVLSHAVVYIFTSFHASIDVIDQDAAGLDEPLVELLAAVDHRPVGEASEERNEIDNVGDRTGTIPVYWL